MLDKEIKAHAARHHLKPVMGYALTMMTSLLTMTKTMKLSMILELRDDDDDDDNDDDDEEEDAEEKRRRRISRRGRRW